MAQSQLHHFVDLRACGFVAVDRASVERPLVSRLFAKRAMKLELEYRSEEIASIGRIPGDVILGPCIELGFITRRRRRNALILLSQLPLTLVVVSGPDLA